jgi:hypothetical protein
LGRGIMPEKLIKNAVIARSGIYQYLSGELSNLGLSLKDAPIVKDVYNVYRPSITLLQSKDKFSRLPLTLTHPLRKVDQDTFKELAVGFSSDSVMVEYLKDNEEIILKTSISINDKDAIDAYNQGIIEMSPGYDAKFKWQTGKTPKGESYDIIMTDVSDANHLALVQRGRGGSSVKILDSKGGNMPIPKILSGLWRTAKKIVSGVMDADLGKFREGVDAIVKGRNTLSDEEMTAKIDELKSMTSDLPDSEEKEKLIRFIEDFRIVKEKDDATAAEAGKMIADLFEKLDTSAMEQTPAPEKPTDETPPLETVEKKEEPKDEDKPGEPTVPATGGEEKDEDLVKGQELTIPEKKEEGAKDVEIAPEKAQYIVQEILKLIQGGGASDGCDKSKDEKPEEQPKPPKKEEEKKVGDSDPMYKVSLGAKEAADSLDAFWNEMKHKGGK